MASEFRQFAPATQQIDQAWSTSCSAGDAWTHTGHAWGTNMAPRQVQNAGGLLGVQKPGHGHPDNPYIAATEKIVADLAYELGLPVPPMTLWDRGVQPPGEPQFVAISAWAFQAALTWDQAQPALQPSHREQLVRPASAMMPFETWVGAEDRQNGGNVLVSVDPSGEALGAWIDYAFALDHGWKGNPQAPCSVSALFPNVGQADSQVIKMIADRIAAFDIGLLEGIINRIPAAFLPGQVAANIIRNLTGRRAIVRGFWP